MSATLDLWLMGAFVLTLWMTLTRLHLSLVLVVAEGNLFALEMTLLVCTHMWANVPLAVPIFQHYRRYLSAILPPRDTIRRIISQVLLEIAQNLKTNESTVCCISLPLCPYVSPCYATSFPSP